MKVSDTSLPGVVLLETRIFHDQRGHFRETWNQHRYVEAGLATEFVQDNVSYSRFGVLRGLHYQEPNAQGKLVSVLKGEIWDVAVDVRPDSEHFGRWVGVTLSAENGSQLYIPEGFAHGFVVTSSDALVMYKCTRLYDPASEQTLLWDDPDLSIDWIVPDPILSQKDLRGRSLRELRSEAFSEGACG
jgi:dTDP-4-dehydrorhamnose 3,5-epimerase